MPTLAELEGRDYLNPCPVDDCTWDFMLPREHDLMRAHLRDAHTGQQFIATIRRLRAELDARERLLREALLGRMAASLRQAMRG